jgi:hypothetical protein
MWRREPADTGMSNARLGIPLQEQRLSRLALAAAALPVTTIFLLYAWRPWKLGFYSDDWLVFLHAEYGSFRSWSDLYVMYQNRPVSGLTTWLAQLAIGGNPAWAQAVNAVLLIVAAIPLGWLTYTLAGLLTERHDARLWGACFAAAAYLAFPWTLGFSAWATAAAAAAPATSLFCFAAGILVGPNGHRLSAQRRLDFGGADQARATMAPDDAAPGAPHRQLEHRLLRV